MSLKDFLKDKIINIILYIALIFFIALLLSIFKVSSILRIDIMIILVVIPIVSFLYEYYKKREFYNNLENSLSKLDKKYLICELLKEPSFLEGKILKDVLYNVDKSMIENINLYKRKNKDLEEYIELWCHEIKTPIATSKMIIANNTNDITLSIDEEISKIDNLVEQVLYYSRSKNVEKDYIIKNVNLEDIIKKAVLRNKKDFLSKKISLYMNDLDVYVKSDSKWLEFIINQVLINSIKYSKEKNPKIWIYSIKRKDSIELYIEDNGIGINTSDLSKVFDKGFTGENGRKTYKSTGMGLYLCKVLCENLYHKIDILSQENAKTVVIITFPFSSVIEDVK